MGYGKKKKTPYIIQFIFLLNFPLSGWIPFSTKLQTKCQCGGLKMWVGL